MRFTISGKNIDVTEGLRTSVIDKLGKLEKYFTPDSLATLTRVLALDPRPQYQNNPDKIYGMPYEGYDIRFQVANEVLTVLEVKRFLN